MTGLLGKSVTSQAAVVAVSSCPLTEVSISEAPLAALSQGRVGRRDFLCAVSVNARDCDGLSSAAVDGAEMQPSTARCYYCCHFLSWDQSVAELLGIPSRVLVWEASGLPASERARALGGESTQSPHVDPFCSRCCNISQPPREPSN